MIKFVVFEIYTVDETEVYGKSAIVIDKITSLVTTGEGAAAFTFIYLMESVTPNENNFVKVKGTLEETMLKVMAADTEPAPAKEWTPTNYREHPLRSDWEGE